MEEMKLLRGILHVKPDDIKTITEGGLFIPESAQKLPNSGIVIKGGRECTCYSGDRVDFMNGSLELLEDGTAIVKESDCFAMYTGNKATLNKMRVHDGWVIVQIPYLLREGMTKSGLQRAGAKSTESLAAATVRYGEIYKTCKSAYNKHDIVIGSYFNKDTEVRVKPGDKVFFSAYCINSIRAGQYFYNSYIKTPDGKGYVIIPYKELICKYDGETFSGLNSYAVASAKPVTKSLLILPDSVKKMTPTEYVVETDGEYFRKGESVFFEPKDSLVTLESDFDIRFEKLYVYFRTDQPMAVNEGAELDFSKRSKLQLV